jgi:hypothetical protein
MKSFLFTGLLGVLLALSSWGFIGGLFFSGLSFGFEGSLLLFHDLFVLLNCFSIHLDGGVAQSTVISVPVLGHENSWTA